MGQRNGGEFRQVNLRESIGNGEKVESQEYPICIDLGTANFKIGYGGDDAPRELIPTVIGRNKDYEEEGVKDVHIGDEALSHSENLKGCYPLDHGFVTNWNDVEKIVSYGYEQLNVKSEDHPVIFSKSWGNPRRQTEKLTQVMFEDFKVPCYYVANQGVLALYASGRVTGQVVTVGGGVTQNVPIYEGYALPHAMNRLNLGGNDISNILCDMLKKNREERFQDSSFSSQILGNRIKEECCYISEDFLKEQEENKEAAGSKRIHELPDGSEISIEGEERFKPPEVLFRPHTAGFMCDPIQESVFRSIMKVDVDIRRDLFASIVLSGGGTLTMGFKERLHLETEKLIQGNNENERYVVNIHDPVERKFDCWIGLSILSSLSTFSNMWIMKQEYDEAGPSIVHRKCF